MSLNSCFKTKRVTLSPSGTMVFTLVTNKIDETRWSRWVESMHKDVECTFGILKGRWRILKTGIRVYGADKVDEIWLTCCALYYWLLDIDGISSQWKDGVLVSDWDGVLGQMDFDGLRESIPNSIVQLSTNLEPCRSIKHGTRRRRSWQDIS